MITEGKEHLVGQDKRDKLYIREPSLDWDAHSKCQNTFQVSLLRPIQCEWWCF